MRKFEKEFRADHPETIGETDKEFDNSNYTEWLEKQLLNVSSCDNCIDGKCRIYNAGESTCVSILTASCKYHNR